MWFVYDRDAGMELFDTEQGASEEADARLAAYLKMAIDDSEWCEDVESLCWGQLSAKIKPQWMVDDDGVETTDMQFQEF